MHDRMLILLYRYIILLCGIHVASNHQPCAVTVAKLITTVMCVTVVKVNKEGAYA
jgi:hypothetical protein